MEPKQSWWERNKPSRKWFVAQVTALGSWVVAAIQVTWEINAELQIVAVGILVEAITTWAIPNKE